MSIKVDVTTDGVLVLRLCRHVTGWISAAVAGAAAMGAVDLAVPVVLAADCASPSCPNPLASLIDTKFP